MSSQRFGSFNGSTRVANIRVSFNFIFTGSYAQYLLPVSWTDKGFILNHLTPVDSLKLECFISSVYYAA